MKPLIATLVLLLTPLALPAQQFPTDDPVIKRIWDEGMTDKSQISRLAQVLLDSIGPRLTSSPGHQSAVQWLQNMYKSWGVPARAERYGTWRSWRRGQTHLDLIAPRVQGSDRRRDGRPPRRGGQRGPGCVAAGGAREIRARLGGRAILPRSRIMGQARPPRVGAALEGGA
jgi:hypothetical protein